MNALVNEISYIIFFDPVPIRFSTPISVLSPHFRSFLARLFSRIGSASAGIFFVFGSVHAEEPGIAAFHKEIEPILKEYCYDCHGEGVGKGGVSLDEFASNEALVGNHELWLKALKNVRAGIMPPAKKPQPSAEERRRIETWIKSAVFQRNSAEADPGKVTVHRLNRVEYRNTIRDLLGIDFDTTKEFPPDDSGRGFDNISDALTLPPMLLEKYIATAKTIIMRAVPMASKVPAENRVTGKSFVISKGAAGTNQTSGDRNALSLSYYDPVEVANVFQAAAAGKYQVLIDFTATERFVDNQFDYNKSRLIFKIDGEEQHNAEYSREGGRSFHFEFDLNWSEGPHTLSFEVKPLTPDQKQIRSLAFRVDSVTIRGPMEKERWIAPKEYAKFFGAGAVKDKISRRKAAREILGEFAKKAYRRPVENASIDRLVALAENTYSQKNTTFEQGVGQAMVAVLASPRFLFREEGILPSEKLKTYPLVDEYSLASLTSFGPPCQTRNCCNWPAKESCA